MPEILHKATAAYKTIASASDHTLECCISSDSCDRDGDVILQQGIKFDLFLKTNPVLLWSHAYQQAPLGRVNKVWLSLDGHRLLSEIEFADHEFATAIEKMYRSRMLNAFSVGIKVLSAGPAGRDIYGNMRPDLTGKATRTIWSAELLEVSCVTLPSQAEAVQKSLKTAGLLTNPQIRKSLLMSGSSTTRKAATPRPTSTAGGAEICPKCNKPRSSSVCQCSSDTGQGAEAEVAKAARRIVAALESTLPEPVRIQRAVAQKVSQTIASPSFQAKIADAVATAVEGAARQHQLNRLGQTIADGVERLKADRELLTTAGSPYAKSTQAYIVAHGVPDLHPSTLTSQAKRLNAGRPEPIESGPVYGLEAERRRLGMWHRGPRPIAIIARHAF